MTDPDRQRDGDELHLLAGVSASLIEGDWEWPLHGLRHPPTASTSGWYVWTGKLSSDDDFFRPWHLSHLIDQEPSLLRVLEMAPGTRFVIAPGYADVWHDPALLEVEWTPVGPQIGPSSRSRA
ncbi:immunity protein Imm33 domain-containing protein [Microbacterium sp. LWH3-1.2]|uniref:immunity protein Imm33 domain-containing protein n=1 Tax=Microbacterium sp. LWH3-1.2 TaxID=3135256 RepID=UPI00343BA720